MLVGITFPSANYGDFEVVECVGKNRYLIKFVNTGFVTEAYTSAIYKGSVKDYYAPSVYGVGYMGKGQYNSRVLYSDGTKGMSPTYKLWAHMMERCYSVNWKNKHPSYKDSTVCERWHNFQYFAEDIPKLNGYEDWKRYVLNISSIIISLDKDKYSKGLKIYSPDTCCFITQSENAKIAMLSR